MSMKTLARLGAAITCAHALLLAPAAASDAFPSKPLRWIVPFPPGGTTDILAREVGAQLAQKWGVPVTIDNKAGASGTIGSQDLQRSAPDGHTLMITATHHVINPSMRKTLPYDTKVDFTPLTLADSEGREILRRSAGPDIVDVVLHAGEGAYTVPLPSGAPSGGRVLLALAPQMPRRYADLLRVQQRYAASQDLDMAGWRNKR